MPFSRCPLNGRATDDDSEECCFDRILEIWPCRGDDRDARTREAEGLGNLISQLFANLYLDGFDHFVTEVLRRAQNWMRAPSTKACQGGAVKVSRAVWWTWGVQPGPTSGGAHLCPVKPPSYWWNWA